jgi:polyisoprenoid-binding protein YceI
VPKLLGLPLTQLGHGEPGGFAMAWNIDKSHTDVGFAVRHMMISTVRGKFAKFDADVSLDPTHLDASKVSARVETASINTGDEKRDGHLRSADFFDSEHFPTMEFQSTKVTHNGAHVEVTGKLKIRGTEEEITLKGEVEGPGKDPWGNTRVGFSLSGEIEREKWALNWNQALETGGVLVAKKVKIELEAQLVQST